VTFANSITLTPGTVSMSVYPDEIHVHALDQAGIEELKAGEMDRRICGIEGKSA
jgi:multicomponent Na+:H+ antiporter subunit E